MIEATHLSLLVRARSGDAASWERLVALCEPLIRLWLGLQSIPRQDADDLAQDVLVTLVRELPKFRHNGRTGSFRAWLRTVTVNRAREFWRAARCRPEAPGGTPFLALLEQLADPDSPLSRQWDAEHDREVCRRLLQVLERDFEPATVQAFRRLVFDGASGEAVAEELNMTRAAVFVAQSRVLRRLRGEAGELLDD